MSSAGKEEAEIELTMVGLAFASFPSGRYSFSVAIMQP